MSRRIGTRKDGTALVIGAIPPNLKLLPSNRKHLILADFYLFDIRRYYKDGFEGFARRANETGSIYTSYIEDLQKRLNETWKLFRQSLVQLAAPFM